MVVRSIRVGVVFGVLVGVACLSVSLLLVLRLELQTDRQDPGQILDLQLEPWPDDPSCRQYKVQFNRNRNRSQIPLASYPESGSTWLRPIIQHLTGYFTGSVYADKALFMQG